MAKSAKHIRLEKQRGQLRNESANEFKFFSATNEFREGMLPEIITVMTRYERIERVVRRYQDAVFRPALEPPLDIEASPVKGNTLHLLPGKSFAE